tara:strand:+ start:506 stop:772 length:267 start_codon:yes stop_codon:yes gene_type:complete
MEEKFYFIKYKIDKENYESGPYHSLENATTILMNLIPKIAERKASKTFYLYGATIEECHLNPDGTWSTISKPIEERKCRKQKKALVRD